MHKNNIHRNPYDFQALIAAHEVLETYVFTNTHGTVTIDFSDPKAVLALNTALLKKEYGILEWTIPEGYLCPPIPGRADYIHHIADLLGARGVTGAITGLDIGTGGNCIYPILATRIYGWRMVGCDSDAIAVKAAKHVQEKNSPLLDTIAIRHQTNNSNLFTGIIKPDDYFDFTLCNPPFFTSAKEAAQKSIQKQRKLGSEFSRTRNFGGSANELWCNGGEALFLKRMIKESSKFKSQVGLFSSLVSSSAHLPKIKKQLNKAGAVYTIVPMEQGNKKSRIVSWSF